METSSRPNGLMAIAFAATTCLLCLLFASTAQAYVDPPVKLGAEAPNLAGSAEFLVENSPREIAGVEPSMTSEDWYKAEFDTSSDMDAATSAELQSELDSMLLETGSFDWAAVLPVAVAAGVSGWVGWEIGSAIWGMFFEEASPSSEESYSYPADRWTVLPAGWQLLADSTGEVYSPGWGLQGANHFFGAGGTYATDTGACEIEIYGDGTRMYAPGWIMPAEFCGVNKFRDYVLWKEMDVTKCGTITECPGIEPVPYEGAGQPEAPTAEELPERIEEALMGSDYPVVNRFLDHQLEPENYPDPRNTEEEEDHRCDRSPGASYENPGGNKSPEPFAKKIESPFTVTTRPEGYGSPSVYLRWGETFWGPGKIPEKSPRYLDDWGGWGYRHILAKHGWSALDREETELALTTGSPVPTSKESKFVYSTPEIAKGIGGVECIRKVVVDFGTGEGDPSPRGIVTSFNEVK